MTIRQIKNKFDSPISIHTKVNYFYPYKSEDEFRLTKVKMSLGLQIVGIKNNFFLTFDSCILI